ncbi:hypothetical protein [Adlercreutzia faecimuris]|uniref:Uncharacterized protein n=1 Tax=Adlercreutzia faecimuris TaxID=2897341 RepID=A0ABS9WF45_9ACTN|nr:hypothetical protein [Adlercreutzia sp. JBNU-10]MCI2241493.1 hypothetical protein [Adlercreutzia sp. JBNU-10]
MGFIGNDGTWERPDDPSMAADAYWSAIEEARERELEAATCGGCRLFAEPPASEFPEAAATGIGWCLAYGCFADAGDMASDYGCDRYEAM